jgi:hypothetical protein
MPEEVVAKGFHCVASTYMCVSTFVPLLREVCGDANTLPALRRLWMQRHIRRTHLDCACKGCLHSDRLIQPTMRSTTENALLSSFGRRATFAPIVALRICESRVQQHARLLQNYNNVAQPRVRQHARLLQNYNNIVQYRVQQHARLLQNYNNIVQYRVQQHARLLQNYNNIVQYRVQQHATLLQGYYHFWERVMKSLRCS